MCTGVYVNLFLLFWYTLNLFYFVYIYVSLNLRNFSLLALQLLLFLCFLFFFSSVFVSLSFWDSYVQVVTYQSIYLCFFFLSPLFLTSSKRVPRAKISYLCDCFMLLRTKQHLQHLHTIPLIAHRDLLISSLRLLSSNSRIVHCHIPHIPLASACVVHPLYLVQVILPSYLYCIWQP